MVRMVRGVRGKVAMQMDFAIRFDYGRTIPWVTSTDRELHAIAGSDMVVLRTEVPMRGEGMSTRSEFTVREGETVSFTMTSLSSLEKARKRCPRRDCSERRKSSGGEWNGQNKYKGPYAEAVERSLMTLKAMTYRPSGGIVAAVTASLPEKIGGSRNWDYRYCWLRTRRLRSWC